MRRRYQRWHLLPHDVTAIGQLATGAKISPVLAHLLINRGIRDVATAQRFLSGDLSKLYPPECLPGVTEAAQRIVRAITQKRRLCIYGDYDVDGVTGTAILWRLLTLLEAKVEYHVPDRTLDGYGLNSDRLRELAARGVSLVISVDCGITSVAEAETAQELGLELIITDHHEMRMGLDGPVLPPAAAVVHPRLPQEPSYPFEDLSGAAVAFKLAWAIAQHACGSRKVTPDLREFLLDAIGLATLGIIADVVPLMDENRILVRYGLTRIGKQPSIGLSALLKVIFEDNPPSHLTSADVGYRLAPHLNVAGRLGCARLAVELLTTASASRAETIAQQLRRLNLERQARERAYTKQALEMIERDHAQEPAIVVASEQWHQGLVGIMANRLVDHYGKPALVIAISNDSVAQGSGRSIPGIELHRALVACSCYLEAHGGHALAAGFKIRPERIAAFRECFNRYVAQYQSTISEGHTLQLDAEVPLSSLTVKLVQELNQLEPFGAKNPPPRLLATDVKLESPQLIGQKEPKRHVAFLVRQGQTVLRCVGWDMAERIHDLLDIKKTYRIAFTPQINTWNGSSRVELNLVDLRED
ncbi:MAG: single-stranded-DNA-specific exonuclease RecJ [Gemmataceae bacterium]|nr:single-stranded-DNA-specific exonuclease RecJ [Gemmata sp.]MDW8198968.1 single-stranded-DNA-specific exonuclease RecJ [Gemmataceae bacterium]